MSARLDVPRARALVLLVDDSATQGQRSAQALEAAGFRVRRASNGREAIDEARRWHPDVIVSDVLMPIMDGFALCREVRRDEALKRVPLVLHTMTFVDPRDEEFGLGLGATRFMLKSTDPAQLVAEVRSVLDAGHTANRAQTALDDEKFMAGYGERMSAKLEEKVAELEDAYRLLEQQSQEKLRLAQLEIVQRTQSEATQRRLAAIVEASNDAIIGTTLDGTVTSWNPGAERLYGYSAAEMVGQSSAILRPVDKASELETITAALRDGARVDHFETIRLAGDGRRLEVLLSASPLEDADGCVVGVAITSRDISERKQAEAQIQALNADLERRVVDRTVQLESAVTELDAFSYSVSHDLRVPLRAVNGFARILLDEYAAELSDEARDYLQTILDSARHMSQLIDDLLALSRLGRQALRKQRVLPAEVARGALIDLAPLYADRSVEIVISELAACDADPALLRQVYVNLLSTCPAFW